MSLLRTLESKIEGLVEGTFGRVFRSEVRPIELARKLVREMDEHRTPSVSRVYAPHEYDLWLSPEDRDHYEGIEGEVIDELCAYLLEHARREQLVLAAAPVIRLHTDHELALGEFGIQTHPVRLDDQEQQRQEPAEDDEQGDWSPEPFAPAPARAPSRASAPASPAPAPPRGRPQPEEVGNTMIQRGPARLGAQAGGQAPSRDAGALLLVAGRRMVVPAAGAVIGRSRECDVVLDDSGISRRHAQVKPQAGGWAIEDLGSTNGLRVNGARVQGAADLQPGDRIEMGSTEIVFELR
jgi:FhaA, N-terminal domain/FHA domain